MGGLGNLIHHLSSAKLDIIFADFLFVPPKVFRGSSQVIIKHLVLHFRFRQAFFVGEDMFYRKSNEGGYKKSHARDQLMSESLPIFLILRVSPYLP